jgi:hypothetical protein
MNKLKISLIVLKILMKTLKYYNKNLIKIFKNKLIFNNKTMQRMKY